MSLFEFLMVLVSIIVGLGIAEVLSGIARLIRYRGSITGYWIHSVFVMAVFFALLQQWWEIWGLHAAPVWTFFGLVMMLAGPVGLFLIAHLLFPEPMQGANLREYYDGAMRPIWWLAAVTVVLSTSFRPLVFDMDLFSGDNVSSVALFFGFVALATIRRPLVHAILVPAFLLLVIVDVFRWNFVIGQD